jgi:hypothetical protein
MTWAGAGYITTRRSGLRKQQPSPAGCRGNRSVYFNVVHLRPSSPDQAREARYGRNWLIAVPLIALILLIKWLAR